MRQDDLVRVRHITDAATEALLRITRGINT